MPRPNMIGTDGQKVTLGDTTVTAIRAPRRPVPDGEHSGEYKARAIGPIAPARIDTSHSSLAVTDADKFPAHLSAKVAGIFFALCLDDDARG